MVLVDEGPRPGGRLTLQLHRHGPGGTLWDGNRVAADLIAEASSVRLISGRAAWGLYPGAAGAASGSWTVALEGRDPGTVEAPCVLLATGAAQNSYAIPGWTLPGVMSVGGAQTLINVHRVRPGRRALVVGVDPLSLAVAEQLVEAGTEVAGIVLPVPGTPGSDGASPAAVIACLGAMSGAAPSAALRLAGRVFAGSRAAIAARFFPQRGVKVMGAPLRLRTVAVEFLGSQELEGAVLAPLDAAGRQVSGAREEVVLDTVVISAGLYPLTELAQVVGCRLDYLPELGGWVPLHGPDLETTAPGLFVAGNITGVEGAPVAMSQGRLAGEAVAARLGRLAPGEAERVLAAARAQVEKARASVPIRFNEDVAAGRARMARLWEERERAGTTAAAPVSA